MIQWAFFAVWVVWLLSVAVAQSRFRSPGLWTWVAGVSLIAVHCYVVWRQVSRLQREMWSRGSQDDETRQARAPFEADLDRLMKSLTPVLLAATGVFVIVMTVTVVLSSVGYPRDFYRHGRRGMPMSEALAQLIFLPLAHAVTLAFVLREVRETPFKFVPRLVETSQHDEPPITLDLEPPPREPRARHDRRST